MTEERDFLEAGWNDADGLALLDRARAECGVRVGPECLAPDVEREAVLLFRALAAWLEAHAAAARLRRTAA
jgi:hypothetical protein